MYLWPLEEQLKPETNALCVNSWNKIAIGTASTVVDLYAHWIIRMTIAILKKLILDFYTSQGPQYVVCKFSVFVCSSCSGVQYVYIMCYISIVRDCYSRASVILQSIVWASSERGLSVYIHRRGDCIIATGWEWRVQENLLCHNSSWCHEARRFGYGKYERMDWGCVCVEEIL